MVQGALQTLGNALTEHSHQWTEGERAVFEQADDILTSSFDGCMETDLLVLEKVLQQTPWHELPPQCVASSMQEFLSGYSPIIALRASVFVLGSTVCRCFLEFWAWLCLSKTPLKMNEIKER